MRGAELCVILSFFLSFFLSLQAINANQREFLQMVMEPVGEGEMEGMEEALGMLGGAGGGGGIVVSARQAMQDPA